MEASEECSCNQWHSFHSHYEGPRVPCRALCPILSAAKGPLLQEKKSNTVLCKFQLLNTPLHLHQVTL